MRLQDPAAGRVCARALTALAFLLLAACAGPEIGVVNTQAGLACVDDSPACVSHRQSALKALVGDPSRSWLKERPTPQAYASGVRLFALKSKKKELSCDELTHGRREAEGAAASLRGTATGLTPAQISRSIMLAGEVGRELGNEYNRRCKKG